MNRPRSETQTLLLEADAVLARMANNRAAMSKPIISVPAYVESPIQTTPPRPTVSRSEWQQRKRTLSAVEQTALDEVLKIRGFIANADLQRTFGLSMQQASVRLRHMCETGLLLREGPGPNSRYRPAAGWPAAQDSVANTADPKAPRIRVATDDDVPALIRLATSESQRAYAIEQEPEEQSSEELELFFGKRLRSNRRLMLVAETASIGIVGHVCAAFEREPLGFLVGKICDLMFDSSAETEEVEKGLVEAARRWLEDRGVAKIKVTVPADHQQAQTLFEQLGFQRRTIEMSWPFRKGSEPSKV